MKLEQGIESYLELLKKVILFEIWQEHEEDLYSGLVYKDSAVNPEKHRMGEIWPKCAHSMIGKMRMDNLQMCMETVLRENIEGDFIETGVWRGGACIFMRGFLKVHGVDDRKVWVADSFEGVPVPNEKKYPKDKGGLGLHTLDYLRVSLEEVQNNFRKYGLLDESVQFLKGWFKDTLPTAPIEKLAILRLDGDLYESTMDSLTNLYDKVSYGGFIIVDDYILPTCEPAIKDFRNAHNIKEPLIPIDNHAVYWRKW
ncbi:TylF/MycF family methyltransferase [Cytobacillus solani]|uniref:Macrocin-O-methyltransferase n=1 Tax=Cytobacillus solani TaxID=1637975 RepID=A0A0Q3T728_9BACI|nr:TylF/MycF family methyltransferase [Cytobacillus solani]KOP82307.1 macrocin-O-methyltransferase [Bacillus sp. FJAT-21945]KQL19317.1 macrocin-O-methyltransferase [Cytobacillus solani]